MLIDLTNAPRDYAWGSTTLIAALQGRSPSGRPEAEVWFGDHPGDPAELPDGSTLDSITGGSLPYLLKLLAAAAPLSIQVHPTIAQARDGFAREAALAADDPARNYRDANHKPELIVALSDRFEALGGLRDIDETLRLLRVLGDAPGVAELRRRLAGDGAAPAADVLRDTIAWLLSGRASGVVADLIGALGTAESDEFETELRVLREIAARNPGDPGVAVALLMNVIVLRRGEGIFLRAGMLHAYVSGLGVEIMAASDNVLRGGLTPKHIDVAELIAVLDATPGAVPVLRPDPGVVTSYDVPVPDFSLQRVLLHGSDVDVTLRGPSIVLCAAGDVVVSTPADARRALPPGSAVFASPDAASPDAASPDAASVLLSGRGEAFVAQPGIA